MTTNDPLYTLNVLKKAIISYLDNNIPNTEDGLNILVSQCDELVWNIATYIYTKSGHQVEFSMIRDIISSRIEPLKQHITYQNPEKARKLAEEIVRNNKEAKRLAEENKRRQEEAQKLAEENKRRQEEENRRLAKILAEEEKRQQEEARKLAEEEKRKQEEEARRLAEENRIKQERLNELSKQLKESGRDESLLELFLQIKDIIVEELYVKPDCVTINSNIGYDLGANDFFERELIMALEEHFNIEFTDAQCDDLDIFFPKNLLSFTSSFENYCKSHINCTVGKLLDEIDKIIKQKN